jgi:hypothetical protein
MTSCSATSEDGSPCGAPPRTGTERCWFHTPGLEAERLEAASRGGRAPRRIYLGDVRPTLDTPEKIARIVESYVGGLASGKATAAQVKAVTSAAHVLLKALELGDLKAELIALRTELEAMKGGRAYVSP